MKEVGYFIDPNGRAELVEIPKDLNGYYKLLDCGTIDIVSRKIGGQYYDIVCDDEGMFKKDVCFSMVANGGMPMLVGRLLICNHDGKGNEVGLTPEDIENIKKHIYCYIEGEY